ncbi:uncharacterized protein LOC106448319 [Brassica napus]|uniref:uncharacterized protein LOC106448319 n=1 Tax=Brassica napus TaxID=3708 RepID=UPI00207A55DF|nr:uncharacterized protein LOC106448319 [Brassica napus]
MQCCVYCGEADETRDHLFFACPYTFTLWLNVVGNLFGPDPDSDWKITLQRMLGGTYERLTYILLRLVWQTTIYFIWRERNDRRHNGTVKSVAQLARLIKKSMKNRISSTRYYLKPRLQGLMQRWFQAHS